MSRRFSVGVRQPAPLRFSILSGLILIAVGVACTPEQSTMRSGASPAPVSSTEPSEDIIDPHVLVFLEDRYPSAQACMSCHPDHYAEWSGSPHAYAQLSPVFNAMHGTILKRTNGTTGDFCIRCHTPVGMAIEEPLFMSNLDRHPTSREGVTCISCHRVDQTFGKVSGRMHLHEGSLTDPVYGPTGGEEVARVIDDPDFGVTTTTEGIGRPIHREARSFFQLVEPGFCGSCHDVTLPNGLRLEEAFSEYKASPAAKAGTSCQDCHMGIEPGIASGYAQGPAAVVGGVPTRTRKRTNHSFVGPDHSVIHPGLFPHNPEAEELATMREWLTFDIDAGWGTDEFEDEVDDDYEFPERWESIDDRYDARDIIEAQQEHLDRLTDARKKLLQRGYVLGEVEAQKPDQGDLRFRVQVKNGTDGHNVPTGFSAERVIFLRVQVRDRDGDLVFESGDLDPNGDLRDSHSVYVHNGELPRDPYLFSLQSKFITTNIRGGEREQVLAVNQSIDPLPFVRPETAPSILAGRPRGARIHRVGIEPGGHRWAGYRVEAEALTGEGPYTATIELIAAMIPVNLVNEIKEVGFDYGMSPREVAEKVVEGHLVLWTKTLELSAP